MNGFGSAGAGNRTGRRTASRVGVGQTAAERNRRTMRAEKVSREGLPPADELKQYIDAGRCWWCDRDANRDGEPWQSLSGHWQRSHGIDAQVVRDILRVPKYTSFVSETLRENQAERGRRNYDRDVLRCKGGPRSLSAYGVEVNRAKNAAQKALMGEDAWRERMAKMGRASGENRRKYRNCVVCGASFWPNAKHNGVDGRRTCSDDCDRIRRSTLAKAAAARRSQAMESYKSKSP